MKPLYPLDEVKRICADLDVQLDRARCIDTLSAYIDVFRLHDFAKAVVAELSPEDFSANVTIDGRTYDEYGVRLSLNLKRAYDIEDLGNFYVKLRITKTRDVVFFISLHELEKKMWRLGGLLEPKGG